MTIKVSTNKAIRKAIKQGYQPLEGFTATTFSTAIRDQHSFVQFRLYDNNDPDKKEKRATVALDSVILSHEFAERLWGEAYMDRLCDVVVLPTMQERLLYIAKGL